MTIKYSDHRPAPGRIVHYWPEGQSVDRIPQAAIVVHPGFGCMGPHLKVLTCEVTGSGYTETFHQSVYYGGDNDFGANPGEWTWPART